jgi:hypothetical protein
MEKVHKFRYFVVPKENITIEVTCINFGSSMPSVEMVLDDGSVDMPNTGTNSAPVYKFKVTMPVDEAHQVHTEFNFQHDAPDNAQYKVDISGKKDVGCPCGFTIKRTTHNQEPDIVFDVRKAD